MIRFSRDSEVDVDSYARKLEGKGYITVDVDKMMATLQYFKSSENSLIGLSKRAISANSGLRYRVLEKSFILDYLRTVEMVPEKYFGGSDSLAADVLNRIADAGYATDFIEAFVEKNSIKSKNDRTARTIERMRNSEYVDNYGNKLFNLGFAVKEQENRRFYYNNSDLIGIATEYHHSFAARKGFCLVWGDLKQADLRIVYNLLIRDERNADLMASTDDSYEGICMIVFDHFKEEYSKDWFLKNRNDLKEDILASIYGQESGKTAERNTFVKKFKKYLSTCPRYVKFLERIDRRVKLGLPVTISSYFGHVQTILKPSDTEIVNRALNTPAQTGTSEVIILITNYIAQMFEDMGFGEDMFRIYMARHDEIIFEMSLELMEHSWVLEQCRRVMIDDMTEIGMDFSFGYNYKEISPDLIQQHKESIEANRDKIDILERGDSGYEYHPIGDVVETAIDYTMISEDKMLFALVTERNELKLTTVGISNPDEELPAHKYMLHLIDQNVRKLLDQHLTGFVVYNRGERFQEFRSAIMVQFNPKQAPLLQAATVGLHKGLKALGEKTGNYFEYDQTLLDANTNLMFSDLKWL